MGTPAVEAPSVEVPTVEPSAKGDLVEIIQSKNLSNGEIGPEKTLQVYEDPAAQPETTPTQHLLQAPNVLEELPVNKNNQNSPDSETKRGATPEKVVSLVSSQRLLDSGIIRVRARTLDIHGFRKLQRLIQGPDHIWRDEMKFDQLLLSLLEFLEEPNDESKPAKALDLKWQILATIQMMSKVQPQLFSTFHPRTLCALLTARKNIPGTSHLGYNLTTVVKSIAARCQPDDCLDAVLDLLETETSSIHESSTLIMGMSVLECLLRRYDPKSPPSPLALDETEASEKHQLTSEQEIRMGMLATRYLADNNPDVRRANVQYILQLHDYMSNETRFWKLMGSGVEDHRALITYYIAKRAEASACHGAIDY